MIHVMWDDRRQRFVAFYKVWELKGREVTPGGPPAGFAPSPPHAATKSASARTRSTRRATGSLWRGRRPDLGRHPVGAKNRGPDGDHLKCVLRHRPNGL